MLVFDIFLSPLAERDRDLLSAAGTATPVAFGEKSHFFEHFLLPFWTNTQYIREVERNSVVWSRQQRESAAFELGCDGSPERTRDARVNKMIQ